MQKTKLIRRKVEPMQQNIWLSYTKCIQPDCSIQGLSVQGLVSHIIKLINIQSIYTYIQHIYLKDGGRLLITTQIGHRDTGDDLKI